MHSDHSATYLGKVNGAEVIVGQFQGQRLEALQGAERPQQLTLLSREDPFGLTIIVGGTNVRFCISRPGDPEPLTYSVKWQELSDELTPSLKAQGVEFGDAHNIVYPILAKRFINFLEQHFDPSEGPLPIENLCSLNFSIAGRVFGDLRDVPGFRRPINGIDAQVSTTNTGLKLSKEPIGRVFYEALTREVPNMRFPEERVFVLNDARAGLEGEKLLQNLPPESRVFFEICGTGDGSEYDEPGFDEIGHRTMLNSRNHNITVHVGDAIAEFVEPDGSFKNLSEFAHLRYAENMLAGPWTAIRFVKSLEEKHEVLDALADRIALKDPLKRSSETILAELYALADLQFKERTRWAVNSNSYLIRAVNELIFHPDHREVRRAMPCNFNVESLEASNPEKALVLLAWARQKLHFKERGTVAGAIYREMKERGIAPDRYILGGGLGELFNRYAPEDRQDALDLINEHGKLPPGVFDFSSVSPEARESAISYKAVEDTKKNWDQLSKGSARAIELAL